METERKESMRSRLVVVSAVICSVVLLGSHRRGAAESQPTARGLKIGVLSVRQVFRKSDRSAAYRKQVELERQKTQASIDRLQKEIELEQARLKTLRSDSNDYMVKLKTILEKRAQLETEKDFFGKKMSLLEQQVTERLYRDILQQTKEVAEERGLDLVFECSEPEIPAQSPTQLELAMGTHKLLYSRGCVDITGEVIARIDAMSARGGPSAGEGVQPVGPLGSNRVGR